MSNLKLLFTKSSNLSRRDERKKRRLRSKALGFSLISLQIIISIIFLKLLFYINILPYKYTIMLVVVLILVTAYNLVAQFAKSHILGKALSILLSITLLTGSFYIAKATNMLDTITNPGTTNTTISVIVLTSDAATNITSAKDYKFGYHTIIDKVNTDKAIAQTNEKLNTTLKTSTYSEWKTLAKSLYDKDVNAIILNEAYRSSMIELYPDFDSTTKVIETITIQNLAMNKAPDKNVSKESFAIYIAGNDTAGSTIPEIGRNDVNIIATFNPKTKQVLLVTTPRDYYIPLDNLAGNTGLDKLTHAGNFGIEGSITALENLYGTELDYFVKVNFSGAIGIVEALGGVTINSELAFSTTRDTAPITYRFVEGVNEDCSGEKVLAFCRERNTFANGDNQRGRNQMLAIEGIIAKAASPAIITNYSAFMDSISDMIATSIPSNAITNLVKNTLSDSTPWNIQTYNVTGTGATKHCELFGDYRSVTLPDYDTVNIGIELMSKIHNGEIFDVEKYISSLSTSSTKAN